MYRFRQVAGREASYVRDVWVPAVVQGLLLLPGLLLGVDVDTSLGGDWSHLAAVSEVVIDNYSGAGWALQGCTQCQKHTSRQYYFGVTGHMRTPKRCTWPPTDPHHWANTRST